MVYNDEYEEDASIFEGSTITTFDEFQYFTGLTTPVGTFADCSSLIKAPIIPESITSMIATFIGCSSLVEAPIIPEGVTSMVSTFPGCSSLIDAPIIPESVTNMSHTFNGCSNLNGKFIVEAVTPPTINSHTFFYVNVISIKVPSQSVDAYKKASGWVEYADKIFPIT